ncbi:hypothetical protein A3H75_02820 [Candidatus Uhrbacteria bacterium RIFCSPLOWO2_02_FULL_51_9]|uniref:Gcp-like domain-containing protein n=1 Tax=Candidatus Uhrbacteria bacterium RIFCSPLOWO2_02_FULL_51_9 TaxID=1802410 RepID=A0A1F7VDV7_9BACT|nr:MAG: hypothetical protein A3H75_02820 [Candidatus Uhrbacteria bacterium RIFCSPLOWO2_02_FULL_51_9]
MIKPTLFLESGGDGITITLRAERMWKRRVRTRDAVLLTIDRLLSAAARRGRDLGGIEVALGQGTFSETRAVVAIANALSYAFRVPLRHGPLAGRASAGPGTPFITATYKSEPRITR